MPTGYENKTVAVYGLGKSGLATARTLAENKSDVLLLDDKSRDELEKCQEFMHLINSLGAQFVSYKDVNWAEVTALFKAPGIEWDNPVLKAIQDKNIPIKGDVDLLYRLNPSARFIGITGTNGKSTTTALVGHILESAGLDVATGGNIGNAVLTLPQNKDIYVLEMSSYQLELVDEIAFDRAVILNLTPDHLTRHGDMQGYLNAKLHIFDRQNDEGKKVIGVDTPLLQDYVQQSALANIQTVSAWSTNGHIHVNAEGMLNSSLDLTQFKNVPGRHNWQNIAAAYALLEGLVSDEQFEQGVVTFKALPHRMEQVQDINGVLCVNDSKATNPESANHALNSFKNIYWVVGGVAKDEGITPCLPYLNEVQAVFTIGECGNTFASELEKFVQTFKCDTLKDALKEVRNLIHKQAPDHACLLLSPACASFDQFDSFEHRGDVFASLCRELFREEDAFC